MRFQLPAFSSSNYPVSLPHSFEKKKKVDVCMNKWLARAFGLILLHDFYRLLKSEINPRL